MTSINDDKEDSRRELKKLFFKLSALDSVDGLLFDEALLAMLLWTFVELMGGVTFLLFATTLEKLRVRLEIVPVILPVVLF